MKRPTDHLDLKSLTGSILKRGELRMPRTLFATRSVRAATLLAIACLSFAMSGCTSVLSPIDTIPVERVPPQFLAEEQTNKRPIDVSRLRQSKPDEYTLDSDDVLGIFIEGVLGSRDEAPPVQIPDPTSDLPPAMGFPVPVREDRTISLPLVKPIPVRGLTIRQAEQLIKRTYTSGEKLDFAGRCKVHYDRDSKTDLPGFCCSPGQWIHWRTRSGSTVAKRYQRTIRLQFARIRAPTACLSKRCIYRTQSNRRTTRY